MAITVIGHDRPGIIAEATTILAELGLNVTDSTMTRLRGHFAMTLICVGDRQVDEVERGLAPLTAKGDLVATVRAVVPEEEQPAGGQHYIFTVHGADRLGIVAAMTSELARRGGNITDLNTRLAGPLYLLVAEVDFASDVDTSEVEEKLSEVGERFGVEVSLRTAEADVL